MGQFLSECRKSLEKDFPELRSVATDNLMYIKEDLILPHVSVVSAMSDMGNGEARGLLRRVCGRANMKHSVMSCVERVSFDWVTCLLISVSHFMS